MDKNGPVIIIEDDMDDQRMLKDIFTKLSYSNEVVFFTDGNDALKYLNQSHIKPFIVLSDVKMPKINGFELRSIVHSNELLHLKCIPYLFFTTGASRQTVIDAYSHFVQGFFIKPGSIEKLENTIRKIMEYWSVCIAPNEFEEEC